MAAVWSREGLGGAFGASRCWLLVFVEVQLIPSSKMTSIHPYISVVFFFPWFSGASHLFLEKNVGSPTSVGLCRVERAGGWWLEAAPQVENATIFFIFEWLKLSLTWKKIINNHKL